MVLGKSNTSTLCFKSSENHKVGKLLQEVKLGFEWGWTPSNHMYPRGECLHALTCWTKSKTNKPSQMELEMHITKALTIWGVQELVFTLVVEGVLIINGQTTIVIKFQKNALIFIWLLVLNMRYIAKVRSHLITMYSSRSISCCLPKSLLKWISS